MTNPNQYDVIIVGGSYSGLAAGLALGRALKKVLILDSGLPCNAQTPHSHNFLTQDGKTPQEIAQLAMRQLKRYKTVHFHKGLAIDGIQTENGFETRTASGQTFKSKKLIFATGIRDILPRIDGVAECWGISVLHCPYCHGYEVKNKKTGVLGNGDFAYEFSMLISNWTRDLTIFTNGISGLTKEQALKLGNRNIRIEEGEIENLEHHNGNLHRIILTNGRSIPISAMYTQTRFEQHCTIPESLGCSLTDEGYISVDPMQRTSVGGVFACGDNTTRMRTLANAVAMGTTAGMIVNKELVLEEF